MRKYKTKTKTGLPKKACIRNTSLVHYRVFHTRISHQKMKAGKTEANQAIPVLLQTCKCSIRDTTLKNNKNLTATVKLYKTQAKRGITFNTSVLKIFFFYCKDC